MNGRREEMGWGLEEWHQTWVRRWKRERQGHQACITTPMWDAVGRKGVVRPARVKASNGNPFVSADRYIV